jgi:hypothetical protein
VAEIKPSSSLQELTFQQRRQVTGYTTKCMYKINISVGNRAPKRTGLGVGVLVS